jgi:hypothetical protein
MVEPNEHRAFRIVALGFLATLAFLECGTRALGDRTIVRQDFGLEYRRRAHWLARQPAHDVVLAGDSAVEQGLAPAAMAEQGVDAINIAVQAGSGIVAYYLASTVHWRPRHVVFGGMPLEIFDYSWGERTPLQEHERQLVSVFDPEMDRVITADLVLGRMSAFYDRRARLRGWLRSAWAAREIPPPLDPTDTSQSFDDTGFAGLASTPYSSAERRAEAEEFLHNYGETRTARPGVRARMTTRALSQWSAEETRRTLIMMPIATEWSTVFAHAAPHELVRTAWKQAASAAEASLLDCSRAMPDTAFRSVDHLTPDAAADFSRRMASWLLASKVPAGCDLVQ